MSQVFFSAKAYAEGAQEVDTIEDVIAAVAPYQGKYGFYSAPVIRAHIAAGQAYLSAPQTVQMHRISGQGSGAVYTRERARLHEEMLEGLSASPFQKKPPRLILLAGRSGSGKTSFLKPRFPGIAYVDTDAFVKRFPEYNGLNAWTFHEESVDVAEKALEICRTHRISALVETTLGTQERTLNRIRRFTAAGYQVELHYVYVPPFESACRALKRFLDEGPSGRYLPISRLLTQTAQEAHFDVLKTLVDRWGFYANPGANKGLISVVEGMHRPPCQTDRVPFCVPPERPASGSRTCFE